jgi:hypothetical protein
MRAPSKKNTISTSLRDCLAQRNIYRHSRSVSGSRSSISVGRGSGRRYCIPAPSPWYWWHSLIKFGALAGLFDSTLSHRGYSVARTERARVQSRWNDRDRRFLWECITDKGSASCLFFPSGMVDLRVLLISFQTTEYGDRASTASIRTWGGRGSVARTRASVTNWSSIALQGIRDIYPWAKNCRL